MLTFPGAPAIGSLTNTRKGREQRHDHRPHRPFPLHKWRRLANDGSATFVVAVHSGKCGFPGPQTGWPGTRRGGAGPAGAGRGGAGRGGARPGQGGPRDLERIAFQSLIPAGFWENRERRRLGNGIVQSRTCWEPGISKSTAELILSLTNWVNLIKLSKL